MVVMDAGIAAVLGAGVGTIGMIVTGWTARSATKTQMRNESLRERREPRRASYEAFSSAVATLQLLPARAAPYGLRFFSARSERRGMSLPARLGQLHRGHCQRMRLAVGGGPDKAFSEGVLVSS